MKLHSSFVKSIKPGLKSIKYFDGRGLFLLVNPNGSKYWRFKYRFKGKEQLLSLGVYPDIGLARARKLRNDLRKQVANKIDPSAKRKKDTILFNNSR
tara:strand:- start:186 stop:476 length:291 start_codon:yes stop_codon:yes gene_type:complete